jgi:type III secretion protein S
MTDTQALARDAIALILVLSLPALAVAALTGIVVGLAQSITQIQDQAISYGIKVIAVSATVFFTGAWMKLELLRLLSRVFLLISVSPPPG